ncbi:hypothetical protein RHSIM_Rhsim08G0096200 [Rhododendron simsii]|uniref:AB hydrolase-1 domain-containing protein n=1 Tax=Rhododendron simsii TaxID=118357 RepID=A0A834GG02_RHOSS|nr:hypothetical protein RHSIM_Rhsim08G0096200 [Rhododendron simsii]
MGIVEEAHNVKVLGPADRPTIVLAHGFGTDQSVWKHLVPHLVDDYRVVLFDNMGAGTTNPEYFDFERYATLEGYAYDVLALLEELRVESCVFVGHSVSAVVGAIASVNRPDLFSKIIMISASPSFRLKRGLNLKLSSPATPCSDLEMEMLDFFNLCLIPLVRLRDMDSIGFQVQLELLNFMSPLLDYSLGFDQEDLDQLFEAMASNYKAWCSGFAPLAVGGDMDSVAVQEFSRTLFNMRPDIALRVGQTIFQSDYRNLLCHVTVPCHIIQSLKDLAVPVVVSEYLHQNLGGESIVEVMSTDGHLPQLSSPDVVVPVLLRHIRYDIAV